MKKLFSFFLFVFCLPFSLTQCADTQPQATAQPQITTQPQVEFCIVIPSYNNEKWCDKNLESCLNQTYPFFSIIYIDDASKDKTGQMVDAYIQKRHLESKCRIIHNTENQGALANLYNVIQTIDPHTVVITVDGDDWLANTHVLEKLAQVYSSGQIWMTYGNYKTEPSAWKSVCANFPDEIIKNRAFRSPTQPWIASHLRTFYAKLFQLIKKEDFLHEGKFFPMGWDCAFMYPMLEMASQNHFQLIPDVLYIYNLQNPISDFQKSRPLQVQLEKVIRAKPPYQAINTLF